MTKQSGTQEKSWRFLGNSTVEGSHIVATSANEQDRLAFLAVLVKALLVEDFEVNIVAADTQESLLSAIRSDTFEKMYTKDKLEECIQSGRLSESTFSSLPDGSSKLFHGILKQKDGVKKIAYVLNLGREVLDDEYALSAFVSTLQRYCKLPHYTLLMALPYLDDDREYEALQSAFVKEYTSVYLVTNNETEMGVLQTKKPISGQL